MSEVPRVQEALDRLDESNAGEDRPVRSDYTRSSGHTTPPTVTAIGSQGIYPRAVKLRFRVKDDSGKARAGAVVFQGKKPIWSHSAVSVVADGRLFWFSWKPPATFREGAYISYCITHSTLQATKIRTAQASQS